MTTRQLERLVRDHGSELRRVARSHVASPADADDAYARGLEVLVRNHRRLDGDCLRYAIVVVKHEAWAMRHERRRRGESELAAAAADPRVDAQSRVEVLELLGAIARLKPQQRTVLGLRAGGASAPQIEHATGRTRTWVHRHLYEGREALREAV